MAHQSGTDRQQMFFFSLEDQIGSDHPVRAIDAFVDSLELSALGFQKTQAKRTGSPPVSSRGFAKAVYLRIFE